MDQDDLTHVDEDRTPVTSSAFDVLAHSFNLKVQALKNAAHHVHQLNPISATYLALYLYEVLEVGRDLYQLLDGYSNSPSRITNTSSFSSG